MIFYYGQMDLTWVDNGKAMSATDNFLFFSSVIMQIIATNFPGLGGRKGKYFCIPAMSKALCHVLCICHLIHYSKQLDEVLLFQYYR